jgi:hypothetical protein
MRFLMWRFHRGQRWKCGRGTVRTGARLELVQAGADLRQRPAQVLFLGPQALEEIAILVGHASRYYVASAGRHKSGRIDPNVAAVYDRR